MSKINLITDRQKQRNADRDTQERAERDVMALASAVLLLARLTGAVTIVFIALVLAKAFGI